MLSVGLCVFVGEDKNIQITATKVLPTHKTKEEESSGWFVNEKKRYHLKSEDWVISVSSSYDRYYKPPPPSSSHIKLYIH
jgi:hypothetical protein